MSGQTSHISQAQLPQGAGVATCWTGWGSYKRMLPWALLKRSIDGVESLIVPCDHLFPSTGVQGVWAASTQFLL